MQTGRIAIVFLALWAMSGVSEIKAAQPLTKIIMTSGSFSEREAAMYVAQDHGFFRRYGLDLTFVTVRSGPVGMAAMASGESQFHSGSATGARSGLRPNTAGSLRGTLGACRAYESDGGRRSARSL